MGTRSRLLDTEAIRNISKITTPEQQQFLLQREIEQIKQNGMYKIGPALLNGGIFLLLCLLIYSVLHYKYYRRKSGLFQKKPS
jgi:hypothetical protein